VWYLFLALQNWGFNLDVFLQVLAAFLGATCFSVLFRVPRAYLPHTITLGALTSAAVVYIPSSWAVGFGTFIVALTAGCLSHALARATNKPAQIFIIPAIIFLVPGTFIYKAFAAALEKDMDQSFTLFASAIIISIAISFGLLLANWVVPAKRTL